MIINQPNSTVQVSAGVASKSFSLKATAKAFQIFSSNVYTDKVSAVIREICCNAWDSHVEAGHEKPFLIHLPTKFEQWFSVRDYGTGISPEQMNTLYTEFFTSTRNESNDYTGALGIGRMAPLCLVDTFLITSYYNGTQYSYACHNGSGVPELLILGEAPTDEPNGLEIKLMFDTSNLSNEFLDKAVEILVFFKVLPECNLDSFTDLIKSRKDALVDHDSFLIDTSRSNVYGSRLYALMGNVAYRINSADLNRRFNFSAYLKFNIGELEFDPGRENITLTIDAKNIINKKIESVVNTIEGIADDTLFKMEYETDKVLEFHRSYKALRSSYLSSKYSEYKFTKPCMMHYKFRRKNHSTKTDSASIHNDSFTFFHSSEGKWSTTHIKRARARYDIVFLIDDDELSRVNPKYVTTAVNYAAPPRTGVSSSKPTFIGKAVNALDSRGDLINPHSASSGYVEISSIPDSDRVFIPVYNKEIYSSDLTYSQLWAIIHIMKQSGSGPSKIYYVHEKTLFSKKMKSISYVNFLDVARKEIDKLPTITYQSVDSDTNEIFEAVNALIKANIDLKSKYAGFINAYTNSKNVHPLHHCYSVLGKTSAIDDVKKMANELSKKDIHVQLYEARHSDSTLIKLIANLQKGTI